MLSFLRMILVWIFKEILIKAAITVAKKGYEFVKKRAKAAAKKKIEKKAKNPILKKIWKNLSST
jgi:hypothetical protein